MARVATLGGHVSSQRGRVRRRRPGWRHTREVASDLAVAYPVRAAVMAAGQGRFVVRTSDSVAGGISVAPATPRVPQLAGGRVVKTYPPGTLTAMTSQAGFHGPYVPSL
jgi:hypothetical protein